MLICNDHTFNQSVYQLSLYKSMCAHFSIILSTKEYYVKNVLNLTSKGLLNLIKLQDNTDLRNSIQKYVGVIEGKSITIFRDESRSLAELCHESRIKRFVSLTKTNSYLPQVNEDCSFVIPTSHLGSNNNSC